MCGLSAPTAINIIEQEKLFHVSADFILELETTRQMDLSGLTEQGNPYYQ